MPEDVVTYLADNITDNIRRLKAAVAQLLTFGNGTQNPLDIDMARALVPVPRLDQQSEKQFTAVSVTADFRTRHHT
jgi:chromosomal replication initiation ATPase DnaA